MVLSKDLGFKSDDDTEKGFFVFCRNSQRINHDFTVPAGRRRGAVSASVVGRAKFEDYYSEPRYDTSNEDGAPGYLAGFLKKAMEGRLQRPLEFGRNDKKVFEFLQGLPASFKTILWRRAVWYNYIAKLQE